MAKTIQQLRELNLSNAPSENVRVAKPPPNTLMKPGKEFGVEVTTAAEMIRNRMQAKKALPQQPLIPNGQSALGAGVRAIRNRLVKEATTNPNFRNKELIRLARRKGVDLELNSPKRKHSLLGWIKNREGRPGAGSQVLQDINKEADRTKTTMELVRTGKLENYYKAHGYKLDPRDKWKVDMIRKPGSRVSPTVGKE